MNKILSFIIIYVVNRLQEKGFITEPDAKKFLAVGERTTFIVELRKALNEKGLSIDEKPKAKKEKKQAKNELKYLRIYKGKATEINAKSLFNQIDHHNEKEKKLLGGTTLQLIKLIDKGEEVKTTNGNLTWKLINKGAKTK